MPNIQENHATFCYDLETQPDLSYRLNAAENLCIDGTGAVQCNVQDFWSLHCSCTYLFCTALLCTIAHKESLFALHCTERKFCT